MTKIKICGLRTREDILAVNQAKPDYCGFIIEVPKSRRSVNREQVKELTAGLCREVIPVGVFVIAPVYSISAGLDYPGIGPEHANLYDTGRAEYVPVTDEEAVEAFEYLSRTEGIIPAIESAHAVAYAKKIIPQMRKDQCVVITISGRGDKDCAAIARYRGEDIYE